MTKCVIIVSEIECLNVELVVSNKFVLEKSSVFNGYLNCRRGDFVFVLARNQHLNLTYNILWLNEKMFLPLYFAVTVARSVYRLGVLLESERLDLHEGRAFLFSGQL